MINKLKKSILLFIVFYAMPLACNQSFKDAIESIVVKFNRKNPITILEIGADSKYVMPISKKFKVLGVSLMKDTKNCDHLVSILKQSHITNVMVLNPTKFNYDLCYTLTRCEHFDVSIVHAVNQIIEGDLQKNIGMLCKLGDFVFIELDKADLNKINVKNLKILATSEDESKVLLLSSKPKITLDIARFSLKWQKENPNPRYHIKSSFNKKLFYKRDIKKAVDWISGINLVTFIMLSGIYPSDSTLKAQFLHLKNTVKKHNDLTLGNLILQGSRLIPIDFNDNNRYVSVSKGIRLAFEAFKKPRLENPEQWMREYYESF